MSVNIQRDNPDKFYRYKMPKLVAKIEGRGNGIKTVVTNMNDIAKALHRPPMYPTKFFGAELGAQVTGEAATGRYIITGAHDQEKLACTLDGFIDKFVLCGSCKNPETVLVLQKDVIMKDCKACGAKLPVDMRHKLCTFILKTEESQKKARKARKGAEDTGTPPETSSRNYDEAGEALDKIQNEAQALPTFDGDEEHEFMEDTSPEAVARRQKELEVSGAVAKMMIADDEQPEDPYEDFAAFVTASPSDISGIVAKANELLIREDKACAVLAQILFDDQIIAKKQVHKHAPVFQAFFSNGNDGKCQKAILGGIERLVIEAHPSLLQKVPLIMKELYDADVVVEEGFLAWAEKPSKKYVSKEKSKQVHEKAAPFINWLKEAEEEDSDDE